jgi:hypothetical protein
MGPAKKIIALMLVWVVVTTPTSYFSFVIPPLLMGFVVIQHIVHLIVCYFAFPAHKIRDEKRHFEGSLPPEYHEAKGYEKIYRWMFIQPTKVANTKKTIVFCHGNLSTIKSQCDIWTNVSNELGCQFILLEYPKYMGDRERRFSNMLTEKAILKYCTKTLKKALEKHASELDLTKMYFAGKSVGTGVAARLAIDYPKVACQGLLLLTPYTSLMRIYFSHYFRPLIKWVDVFDTEELLETNKFTFPIVAMSAEKDNIIPAIHIKLLQYAAEYKAEFHEFSAPCGHHELTHENLITACSKLLE